MKPFFVLFISILFVLGSSCSREDDPNPIENENLQAPQVGNAAPPNSSATTIGIFTSFAHGLSGKAVLYIDAQGGRTLRFENFTMTVGPDVYVLFSKTNNYSAANSMA